MTTTRAVRTGNSQVVEIPAEIAFEDGQELTVMRHGDIVTLYPKRGSLRDSLEKLLAMPVPGTVELIERTEVPDRERY